MEQGPLINVHVQTRKAGEHPISVGQYSVVVLPRVGELIHLMHGEEERCLEVVAIDHYAYSENETAWDGVISLTCDDDA